MKPVTEQLLKSIQDYLRRNLEPIASRLKAVEARIERTDQDRAALVERVRILEERHARLFDYRRPSGRSILKFRLSDGRVARTVIDVGEEFDFNPPALTIDSEAPNSR